MKHKLQPTAKKESQSIFSKMLNIFELLISGLFYLFIISAVILALGDIFLISSYSFASSELLLSCEIIVLMLILYWSSQHTAKSIYRGIWIIVLYKLLSLILMLPNIQKVMAFEECKDMEYCRSFVRENINQENCLKDNGAWNIDDQACDYRYSLSGDCKKRDGNWIYPSSCEENNKK